MRKTKLTSLLMAICCVFACLGIVTLVNQPKNVAKAANDFTITSTLTPVAAASSASHISAYPTDESQKPDPKCGWEETFTFVEGTGTGFTINDEPVTGYVIKQPNDFEIDLPSAAEAGDVLVLDGKFAGTAGNSITFTNCGLSFDGTKWAIHAVYTTHNAGVITSGSSQYPDHPTFWDLRLTNAVPAAGQEWTKWYHAQEDAVITLNGDPITFAEVKFPPDGSAMFVAFNQAPTTGDVLVVEGSFVCNELLYKVTIARSELRFTGASWIEADPSIKYEEFSVGAVHFAPATYTDPTFLTFALADGEFPLPEGAKYANEEKRWESRFALFSGLGITINDVSVTPEEIKFPGQMFINFAEVPVLGDRLVIEGTFYCDSVSVLVPDTDPTAEEGSTKEAKIAIKYTIARSEFVWNGSEYVDLFAYTKSQKAAEIDEYFATFSEEDYNAEEWEAMEEIVANAKMAIDLAVDATGLEQIVVDAKAELDEVQTKEEIAAIIGEKINEAKAELDAYADQADYKDAEWAEIQALIAAAKAEIDKATSPIAINNLVAEAKAAIDEVKTAEEVDAEALATAKTNAKNEINAYYGALNFEEYSDEANATLTQYVTEAKAAVDAATSVADVEAIVAAFKADVDAVEKTQPSTKPSKGGCGASVASGMVTLVPVLALAVCMIIRKKREI